MIAEQLLVNLPSSSLQQCTSDCNQSVRQYNGNNLSGDLSQVKRISSWAYWNQESFHSSLLDTGPTFQKASYQWRYSRPSANPHFSNVIAMDWIGDLVNKGNYGSNKNLLVSVGMVESCIFRLTSNKYISHHSKAAQGSQRSQWIQGDIEPLVCIQGKENDWSWSDIKRSNHWSWPFFPLKHTLLD